MSCCYLVRSHLVISVCGFVRPARFEMLPLSAEKFQFAPVLQFGPQLFFGHLGQFLIPILPTAPVRRVTIPAAGILRQEPFHLYRAIAAALHWHGWRQNRMMRGRL